MMSFNTRHGAGNGPVVGVQRQSAGGNAAAGDGAHVAVAAQGVRGCGEGALLPPPKVSFILLLYIF